MTRRIETDHSDFRKIIAGRLRAALRKFIKNGQLPKFRGKDGKGYITIPKLDIPHIEYGESDEGTNRGTGKKGDVIGRDPQKGKGNKGGQDPAEGITVSVDMEYILKFLQDELQLPNLKNKILGTYDEVKIKYNNISLVGPEALRHNRRTLMQTLKRQAAEGTLDQLTYVPGLKDPIRTLRPISEDKRYRQYNEIKLPASNALLVFARDGSGSMDATKCEVINDMAWWIDVWVRRFYKRVERLYVWHDTDAMEVDEHKFYNYRYGGGTTCSSALKFISKQFEYRFPPAKWNIFVFYFTDGENYGGDNEVFIKTLQEQFKPDVVNLTAVTQIMAYNYDDSVKHAVDEAIKSGGLDSQYVKTASVGPREGGNLTPEQIGEQTIEAIKLILGGKSKVSK